MYKNLIVVLGVVTFFVILMGIVSIKPVYDSKTYYKVVGEITGDDYVESGKSSESTEYVYIVYFDYEYEGKTYSAKKDVPMVMGIGKKPIGSKLDVYINPDNTDDIMLLYGNTVRFIAFGFSLFLLTLFIVKRDKIIERH